MKFIIYIEELYYERTRRFGDGICLEKVHTLPTWISFQDVYKPLYAEIPSEQASVVGTNMQVATIVPGI
jgi:hypothetical protein